MNGEEKMAKNQGYQTCEDEIDILEFFYIIKRFWKKIALFVFIVVSFTIGISFLLTPIYEAKAILAPSSSRSNPSLMNVFATQLGITPPPASEITEVIALLKSKVLQEKVIKKYNLLNVFFKPEDLKDKSEDEKIWECLRFFEKNLKVNYKTKENVVEVSFQFKDPNMSAKVLSYLINELKEHISENMKKVAQTNRAYLESQINKSFDPFVRAKIYNLIANQIEQAMLAEAKENHSFKIIDPPKAPDKKIKPKRATMALLSFFSSLLIGVFFVIVKDRLTKIKKESGGDLNE